MNNVFKESIFIDETISFVEKVIQRYDWSLHSKEKIQSELDFVKSKRADDNLNLSIIGEVSTGKSTLINALLRTRLYTVPIKSDTKL